MKRTVAALAVLAMLLLSASAAGEAGPAAVFSQERELLASGTLAERVALGNGVYILEVTEVSPAEARYYNELTPFDGVKEQEILETWDYELTAVRCRVVGSDDRDLRLYFGRRFVSRSGGEAAPCPDDDFPDPKPGDRLLAFRSGTNGMSSGGLPLWEGRADQRNTAVVLDGDHNVTVCLSDAILIRGSDAVPID